MCVLFLTTIKRHADLPRPREDLRILHRRFVDDDVGARAHVAFDDVQRLAVEVAGAIEPALVVEAGDVDDQRLAFPTSDRLTHPRVDRCRSWVLQIHVTRRPRILVGDEDRLRALEDLKRIRHVVRARHAGQVAFDLGVGGQPVLLVLLFLREGGWRVGNLVAFNNADARRHRTDSAQRKHGRGRHRPIWTRPERKGRASDVGLKVPIRFVHGLPDAVQIRMPVGRARRPIRGRLLTGHRRHRQRNYCGQCRRCTNTDRSPKSESHQLIPLQARTIRHLNTVSR